jgi:hypothetical protein
LKSFFRLANPLHPQLHGRHRSSIAFRNAEKLFGIKV